MRKRLINGSTVTSTAVRSGHEYKVVLTRAARNAAEEPMSFVCHHARPYVGDAEADRVAGIVLTSVVGFDDAGAPLPSVC